MVGSTFPKTHQVTLSNEETKVPAQCTHGRFSKCSTHSGLLDNLNCRPNLPPLFNEKKKLRPYSVHYTNSPTLPRTHQQYGEDPDPLRSRTNHRIIAPLRYSSSKKSQPLGTSGTWERRVRPGLLDRTWRAGVILSSTDLHVEFVLSNARRFRPMLVGTLFSPPREERKTENMVRLWD